MLIQKKQLKDIATWMKAEHPTEFPEILQGIFFMDGNILPDNCITMSSSKWNPDNLTLLLPVFAPKIWTFHATLSGKVLLYFVKFSQVTYLFQFTEQTLHHAHITPILFGWSIPKWIVDFLIDIDENNPNGDIWYRTNSFFGSPPGNGYTLRRIADKNGNYKPAFENMLSKVDNDCLIIAEN